MRSKCDACRGTLHVKQCVALDGQPYLCWRCRKALIVATEKLTGKRIDEAFKGDKDND